MYTKVDSFLYLKFLFENIFCKHFVTLFMGNIRETSQVESYSYFLGKFKVIAGFNVFF